MEAAAVPEVAVPPDNAGPILPAKLQPSLSRPPPIPSVIFTMLPDQVPNILQETPAGLNELHKASKRSDLVHAESLVNSTNPMYDINERVPSNTPILGGYTPLLLAAAVDSDTVVRLLLTHGADPQARTPGGISALHLTVESRLKEPWDYGFRSMKELTSTRPSGEQQHLSIARLLLARGVDIDIRDEWGFTPLHRACNAESTLYLIQFLINSGANVNARSKEGATPLHITAERDHDWIAKVLIGCGAQIDAATNEHRLTPLHLAVTHRKEIMIKLLLKRGADIEAKTSHGYMAIHLAALSNNTDQLAYLLRRGAPVDIPAGEDDHTPLHMTCVRGHDIAMQYLLRAGANVHARCKKGMTPLHTLILHHQAPLRPQTPIYCMLEYLMRSGLDINIRDADGCTALHIACRVGWRAIVHHLLFWNADMFAKDKYNRTPLDYCHPESLARFRNIFWKYKMKWHFLLQRPINDDTWSQKTKDYIERIKSDLRAMACYKLAGNDYTLMDLMLKSAREMSYRVTATQLQMLDQLIFIEGMQHFPIYYVLIGKKIQAINDELKKKDLMRPAKKALNKILGWRMPDDCVSKIFEYLHASDVNNLISAGEHRFITFVKDLVKRGPPDSSRSRGTKRRDAPKVRFSWCDIENDFDSIYSPYPCYF